MAAEPIGAAASDALLARREDLARAITEALYAEMPELTAKYGDRGRAKCLEDMRYNLEHLAPAVALGEPTLFAGYIVWLRDMLDARGIAMDEVRRSLELTEAVVRTSLSREEAALVTETIAAGLAALAPPPA